jgi:hypothetical protein
MKGFSQFASNLNDNLLTSGLAWVLGHIQDLDLPPLPMDRAS